jgi:hypothetical protein
MPADEAVHHGGCRLASAVPKRFAIRADNADSSVPAGLNPVDHNRSTAAQLCRTSPGRAEVYSIASGGCVCRAINRASWFTVMALPYPALKTPEIPGLNVTCKIASMISATWMKSRVCSPSPWITRGLPRSALSIKVATTPLEKSCAQVIQDADPPTPLQCLSEVAADESCSAGNKIRHNSVMLEVGTLEG